MRYKVFIDDNFHYMDEGERIAHGEFETADEALAAAKAIVDESLPEFFKPGMSADEVYDLYLQFGSDPFIVSADERVEFSAREYARSRSLEIINATPNAGLNDWFRVSFDGEKIRFDVSPPNGDEWTADVRWNSIIRVCFKAGDFLESDEVYLFSSERPESYLFPVDSVGGIDIWSEIIRRGLFNAELAIEAAASPGGLFCDPSA